LAAVIAPILGAGFVMVLKLEGDAPILALGVLGAVCVGLVVSSLGANKEFTQLTEALDLARSGDEPGKPPSDGSPELRRAWKGLSHMQTQLAQQEETLSEEKLLIKQLKKQIEDAPPPGVLDAATLTRLHAGSQQLGSASKALLAEIEDHLALGQQTGTHTREMVAALGNIARHVEALSASAEESSSAILEMTTTNDQMAENIGDLGASVRESVASIEEMTFSIKEVAKNVDALSLTAEETSSSMNEMDVSIDQVQSNANETARLSEEVARDAETGAEAILKTIGEIYRIKESSQEAVSVISNLGSRIDAIGQILNVIDEVAEQTNLLALNAAIIAAQAGEHGKGFAVVADEIKDLAERAGASTKEIADLIKTIQAESRNAIQAVERGAQNVDRGVQVSNDAERALKKILESSQKSTNMVRAIARATVEQAKGSKQVTDSIGRIAETVQQIAAATAEQARGSELIMTSGEKMRAIAQQVERSSQEQSRGGRQITQTIEAISGMVNQLNGAHQQQSKDTAQALVVASQIQDAVRRHRNTVLELTKKISDFENELPRDV
jgi:methyl-accepting chemotaxis protein